MVLAWRTAGQEGVRPRRKLRSTRASGRRCAKPGPAERGVLSADQRRVIGLVGRRWVVVRLRMLGHGTVFVHVVCSQLHDLFGTSARRRATRRPGPVVTLTPKPIRRIDPSTIDTLPMVSDTLVPAFRCISSSCAVVRNPAALAPDPDPNPVVLVTCLVRLVRWSKWCGTVWCACGAVWTSDSPPAPQNQGCGCT
jgi:hypothetical protein